MNTLVVLFAVMAVACGSLVPLAQPPHHAALVLDPHGRPLDTAEVINARALHLQAKALDGHHAPLAHAAVVPYAHSVVAPAVLAAPSAVSHQSRVDVHSSPAVVSHSVVAPVVAHSAYASPLLAHSAYVSPLLAHSALGYAGHGHYLKKRSLGHLAYAAPVVAHVAPSAVSHQSRVDVVSSPAVVSHAVAPVVSHAYAAPVVAHAAPVVAVAPSAVSHQSRVDVRTSPAVVSHSVSPLVHAAPVYATSAYAAPAYGYAAYGAHGYSAYGSHAGLALSHAHLLKKRSLAHYAVPVVHTVPSAVSHQSRVDVISKPAVVATYAHAAPAVYAAPAAVYAAPAVSHFTPIAHSAVWSAPHHLSAALW